MRSIIGSEIFDKYKFEPAPTRKAQANLQLWSSSPLHIQHSRFMLQCSHYMHAAVHPWEEWTNQIPRKRVVSPLLQIL